MGAGLGAAYLYIGPCQKFQRVNAPHLPGPWRRISREQWEEVGSKLGQVNARMQWMVGDWLNAGEREGYIDSETYDTAEGLFPHLARKTLQNCASIAAQCSRWREDLSFKHHAEIAALDPPQQEGWLAEAAAEGWSVSDPGPRKRQKQERLIASAVQHAFPLARSLQSSQALRPPGCSRRRRRGGQFSAGERGSVFRRRLR